MSEGWRLLLRVRGVVGHGHDGQCRCLSREDDERGKEGRRGRRSPQIREKRRGRMSKSGCVRVLQPRMRGECRVEVYACVKDA